MQDSLRSLIVDDDYYSRKVIRHFIDKHPQLLKIVGEAENVEGAYKLIRKEKPDVVFLDVTMKNETGFDLLKRFSEIPFEIIFVTAHDHFALRALKISAVDYVVKPVDEAELLEGIYKVIAKLKKPGDHRRLESLLSILKKENKLKIEVHTAHGIECVNCDDILRLEADGNYTTLFLKGGRKHLMSKTIKEFENKLASQGFYRIHRSTIVNMDYIISYEKGRGGSVTLSDGTECAVSYRRKEGFISRFKKA